MSWRGTITTRCRTCRGEFTQPVMERAQYQRRTCDDCKAAAAERYRNRGHNPHSAIPHTLRLAMIAERGPVCPCCLNPWNDAVDPPEIDHVVPLLLGGTRDRSNLRVICRRCNRGKGARLNYTPRHRREVAA